MNIYAGKLPYRMTDDELRQEFETYGYVTSCTIFKDRTTGQSKGFGYLEMPNDNEARMAVENLNGNEFNKRAIEVREARPKDGRPGRDVERD